MITDQSKIENRKTSRRFVRFILVGLVNTGFGYALFALLVRTGIEPQLALALAFAIGVLWNYWTHARLVFGQRGLSHLPAYILSYVFIWGFNSGGLALALELGLNPYQAQALLAPSAAIFSFFLISRVLTGYFPFQNSEKN